MILNGSRVTKTGSDAGDMHRDGDMATVIGSVPGGYFVRWDDAPHLPIFVAAFRVKYVPDPERGE
jgi:hypothetical protein